MKSGLYALAGFSAAARHAACASRLLGPTTKLSNLYFTLRVDDCRAAAAASTGAGDRPSGPVPGVPCWPFPDPLPLMFPLPGTPAAALPVMTNRTSRLRPVRLLSVRLTV